MNKFLSDLLMADLDRNQRTAVWRVCLTALIGLYVSWGFGWLPGNSGFAMASDFYALSDTVTKVELSLLEKDIIEAQERFCISRLNGNREAQRYAEERRRRLLLEWRGLTGIAYDLPSCAALGIE